MNSWGLWVGTVGSPVLGTTTPSGDLDTLKDITTFDIFSHPSVFRVMSRTERALWSLPMPSLSSLLDLQLCPPSLVRCPYAFVFVVMFAV